MNYVVNLTDQEVEELVKFHQANVARLQEKLAVISEEMLESQKRISHILNARDGLFQPVLQGFESAVYNNYSTLSDKAEFVLRKRGKVSTTRMIADLIDIEERSFYSDQKKIGELVSKLGATLKQKVDKAVTFNRREIGGEFFYGLSEWFDNENRLRSDYINIEEVPFDLNMDEKTSLEQAREDFREPFE